MTNYTVEIKENGNHWANVTVRSREEAMEQKAYFEKCGYLTCEVVAWDRKGSMKIA